MKIRNFANSGHNFPLLKVWNSLGRALLMRKSKMNGARKMTVGIDEGFNIIHHSNESTTVMKL